MREIIADLANGRIEITSDFRDKDIVKTLPGARWSVQDSVWWTPASWAACKALRGVFGQRLVVGEALTAWATAEYVERVQPALKLRTQLDGVDGRAELFPFQRVGSEFLTIVGKALLTDEMGTGKTVQACDALRRLDIDGPILVVGPSIVKRAWLRAWMEWGDGSDAIVIEGGAVTRRKQLERVAAGEFKVAIMNWEALRSHTRLKGFGSMTMTDKQKEDKELNAITWGACVFDEAHRAKDPKSQQTRAAWYVAHQQDCYRFALTGTPIANHPGDLWSLLHLIDPDSWPTKSKFVDRYVETVWNVWGGMDILGIEPSTKDEFYETLDPKMIRRTKKAVLPQLPDKTYSTRYVQMSPKQKKAYKALRDRMVADLDDDQQLLATDPLVHTLRLLQLASAYAEIHETGGLDVDGTTPGFDVVLTEPSCKVDALVDILDEMGDESLVVFAESRQLIELCEAKLDKLGVSYGSIHGSIPHTQRDVYVDQFQDGKLQVMLCTVGAGGEGVTLTRASTMLFLQRSWSMVKNSQAEDRIHRIGQDQAVQIIDVVSEGTIEEYVAAKLADKADQLQQIVRDAATLKEMLTHG